MRVVEDGGEPINVLRDPEILPDLIRGWEWDKCKASVIGAGIPPSSFRSVFNKGYGVDDADR